MKTLKAESKAYLFLCVLTLACCWMFVGRQGIFGAKVDWLSQHSVLPDYFRQQFYATGELFPEFAGNLGGGQNIYHFSYYGLYGPLLLPSYLLPFVKMGDYLMAVSIAGILASVCLFYYWLGRRGFSWEIRLSATILFLLAGPMIFQSCHQVMFVNYMPFLCLALLGVDRHFEKGRSGLYAISVFLLIMTSFYFSIGSMLALSLYGLYRYMESGRARGFFKNAFSFLLPMGTAVLMSGFFLLPTAYAIFGKRSASRSFNLWALLTPKLPLEDLVHSAYGAGLTAGVITVLITGLFYQKWSEKLLHGICLAIFTIPLFPWLLNGGLYARGKSLIPFLPLLCYLTAVNLEKQKKKEISLKINILAYAFTILWILVSHFYYRELSGEPLWWYLILAESIVLFVCFCIYWRLGSLLCLTVPPILCLFVGGSFFYKSAGGVLDAAFYNQATDARIGRLIDETLEGEDGFWRLEQKGTEAEKSADLNRIWSARQWISSIYSSAYNADYQKFRKDIFEVEEPFRNDLMQAASDNPLYQKLMGIKYLMGTPEDEASLAAAGYEPYKKEGRHVMYRSKNTAPIAYVTAQTINAQDYSSLEFPCSQTALMKYAVTETGSSPEANWKRELESFTVPTALDIPERKEEDLTIRRSADGAYHIQSKGTLEAECRLDVPSSQETGRLVFLQFRILNRQPEQDVAVWMNGTRNKLSAKNHIYYNDNTIFTYAAALEPGASGITLKFGKGDYEISDLECFLADASLLEDEEDAEQKLYQSLLLVDWEQTKGNRIAGKIDVQNTGYFITSIPYDDGFEIFVDGKRTKAERVNQAFLGCAIKEGAHQVEILYHAPGARMGKLLSCIGLLLFLILPSSTWITLLPY